jgi:hypothetical protein
MTQYVPVRVLRSIDANWRSKLRRFGTFTQEPLFDTIARDKPVAKGSVCVALVKGRAVEGLKAEGSADLAKAAKKTALRGQHHPPQGSLRPDQKSILRSNDCDTLLWLCL